MAKYVVLKTLIQFNSNADNSEIWLYEGHSAFTWRMCTPYKNPIAVTSPGRCDLDLIPKS